MQKFMLARFAAVLALASTFLATFLPKDASAYWAIAYGQGQNKAWARGVAYNSPDAQTAKRVALSFCYSRAKNGATCAIVHSGKNGCAALAIERGGNGWAAAERLSRGGAISGAIVTCTKTNPVGCTVNADFCDTTDGFQPDQMTAQERDAYEQANANAARYRQQHKN